MNDSEQVINHGTDHSYEYQGCRCDICRAAHALRIRRSRAERLASGRLTHGTRSAYDAGCRCPACTEAAKLAAAAYYRRVIAASKAAES